LPGGEQILFDTTLTAPPGGQINVHIPPIATGTELVCRVNGGEEQRIFSLVGHSTKVQGSESLTEYL
jgi:hypothetical protein